jgi:hypothetical protein
MSRDADPLDSSDFKEQHTLLIKSKSFLNSLAKRYQIVSSALLQAYSRSTQENTPLYLCRYPYGATAIGPKSKSHYFSGLLSPCGTSSIFCQGCQSLLGDTEGNRPLILVLKGVVEEYLEFQQVRKRGREEDITKDRAVPLRLAYPGDYIGAYEALNAFYFDDYGKRGNKIFGAPARRLAAGARCVTINAPMNDIARSLKSQKGSRLLSRYYRVNDLSLGGLTAELDMNHSRFLKMLSEAAGLNWSCNLLVIPFSSLQRLIWDGRRIRPEARDLLLEIHRFGWIQSRHSRSAHIRHAAVADNLARKDTNVYQQQIIHHLLEMARGEFPGLAPFKKENEAGPFEMILKFINNNRLADAFRCFPSILQPTHLGQGKWQSGAVYYSFAYPTLLPPLRKQHSGTDLMQELRIRLSDIKRQGRTAVKNLNWHFYISTGLPKPNRPFDIFAESSDAESDFNDQQRLSKDLDRLGRLPFFGPERDGFLSKFIRLSLQSDSL